ncbi:MAG: glycine zipper domain-containing protein [Planctomycetota bacterium]|nr:glycine zipper domain-containing protein [Planctomycetota bacterium]
MGKGLVAILLVVAVSVGAAFVAGCESEGQTDALIGSAAGAGIGAIIGNQSGKAGQGALIGGAVGGGTGYIIGSEKDKKKTQAEVDSLRQEMNTVTVNITNSNGSVSTVPLKKQGVGYVGPRGEYYNHLPTPEELKPIYGF